MKKNKKGQAVLFVVISFVVIVAAVMTAMYFGNPGNIGSDKEGRWADTIVNHKINTYDEFDGSNEAATIKVFDEKPEDYDNPRGDFSDSSLYTSYSASSGVVTINKEFPGHYWLVGTVSGSNTMFMEIDIEDGSETKDDLSEYNQNPKTENMEFSAVGSTTDEDFAFTLTNGTDQTVKDTVSLTVGDDTKLVGWKVIVDDTEGFSVDTDGDGTYDEGIKRYEVTVCGVKKNVFEPAKGIDEFDSNDEYTFQIPNCEVADGDDVNVKVEIKANTGDYTGANDEVWGEGEGVLSYIKIYDQEGNLFSTTDVTA